MGATVDADLRAGKEQGAGWLSGGLRVMGYRVSSPAGGWPGEAVDSAAADEGGPFAVQT